MPASHVSTFARFRKALRRSILSGTGAAFLLASAPATVRAATPYRTVDPAAMSRMVNQQGSLGVAADAVGDVSFDERTLVSLHVTRLFPGSGLQGGPLVVGDRIIAVNHLLFPSRDAFIATVRALPPGAQATVEYVAQGTGECREIAAIVIDIRAVNDAPPVPAGQPGRDAEPTLDDYLARARQGDGYAAMKAGEIIGNHDNATIIANLDRLVPLWEIAADEGVPDGIAAIGFLHYNGYGGYPRDRRQAVAEWQEAAAKGSVVATKALADIAPQSAAHEDHTARNVMMGLVILGGLIWLGSRSGGPGSLDGSQAADSSGDDTYRRYRQPEQPSRPEPAPTYTAPIGGESGLYGSAHGVGD